MSSNCYSAVVVMVDDEREILLTSSAVLRREGLENLHIISDSRDVVPFLASHETAVVVLDLRMPHLSGIELLKRINSDFPHVAVIMMTATNEIDTAVECMKSGAFDYLLKPVENSRLSSSVRRALDMYAMRREIVSLRERFVDGGIRDRSAFSAITTQDQRMEAIFTYLEAIAACDQPILVTGETGVGKELIVRALHALSGRSGAFVPVNVAGLDDTVFSDTLFGHKKGAYTGADQAREGMIAKATNGTLFLDEIGDLNLAAQVKLLRLLQEGEYQPLGSDIARRSNARIVLATNHDLKERVADGAFRKDLYYRLTTHHVRIPPLRNRKGDIPLLLNYFLSEAAIQFNKKKPTIPPELATYLECHHFPGNIRELKSMVYDAMAQHRKGILSMATFRDAIGIDIPSCRQDAPASSTGPQIDISNGFPSLKEAEEFLVSEAIKRSKGNQGLAASMLGISRQALNQRVLKRRSERTD